MVEPRGFDNSPPNERGTTATNVVTRTYHYNTFATFVLIAGAFCSAPTLALGSSCSDATAKIVSVQGKVEARRSDGAQWTIVGLDDEYCPGDTIRVSANSRADVLLADQTVVRLREGTELVIEQPKEDGSYALGLLQGAAHFFSRTGARNVEVETPFTVAGIRGTEFALDVGPDSTVVRVFEGSVLAANDAGSVIVGGGQTAVAARDQAPILRIEARPRDAVRWTLYYLPVLYVPEGGGTAGAKPWERDVARSAAAYRKGDIEDAFDAIASVRDGEVTDAAFFAYRASLSLAVGRVESASADLQRALALAPDDADALALRTVLALADNQNALAMESAQAAVAASPQSATAYIALSYAQQAQFDLAGALASLRHAVQAQPQNALAWARLAEMYASFGETDQSAAAADRAVALDPDLSRTQTVVGFSLLTRVEMQEAAAHFDKAIALDPADPLPRLGLGLAKIRAGHLDAGARDIEVAASLDPSNALIRSYLGKTYYEEKRTGLDEREYAMAKELDPNDPTPWFYDAIAKQTTNRPVEALHDAEKSIELNDNRAVYRSRLLLDSDLAARSASLGRIYSDLGFQNLALVEGWKSVGVDPSNFSAHRLLADSYAALPRHEIARVSELLQSQLLQPINLTPIQPRLGESNLFLLSAQGPAGQSFNEFNSMFNRNQVAVQASGLVGSDDTQSGEGTVSGIYDKASFSAGYSGFWTDGFRRNNDQDDDIATVFAQYEATPNTSLQAEFRYRDLRNGDLELRFLDDDFSPFSNEKARTYSGRGGLRHAFGPNAIVLLSYIHNDRKTDFGDFVPDPFFGDFSIDLHVNEVGDSGEAQYIYRTDSVGRAGAWIRNLNIVSGVGHSYVDVHENDTTTIDFGPPIGPVTDTVLRKPDVRHTNFYSYATLALPAQIALTVGASGDLFDEDDGVGSEKQGNPKAGVTWNPSFSPGTTVRAAAFRVLTRTLLTQQTLEPTEVAGFNQFFDDPPGTDSWRYGVAVDQKFTKAVYAGAEFSKRDLNVPQSIFGGDAFIVQKTNWDEYLTRSYVFWTPHDWVSTRIAYEYEEIKRDPDAFFAFSKVHTHRLPLGIQVFLPNGMSGSFGATYLNQDGKFLRNSDFTFVPGDRDFWVLDVGLRYRLPKRYGFVSFGVNNLLDEDSGYQATDVRNPTIRPGRFLFGAVTLALP